jgi:hypothetical protein
MGVTFDSTETVLDLTNDYDSSLREAGIWAMHAAGYSHLTESNIREFYIRINMWERVNGPYRYQQMPEGKGDLFFSPEDCVRLIGLRTNASTKTKAQFYKSVWDAHERWNFPWNFQMPLDKAVAGKVD